MVSGRSSSTTSHGRLVSPSQLTKRIATDSAVPAGWIPVAATDASTKVDSTAERSMTETQTSTSMACDRHSDSAIITAIWVLPARAQPVRRAVGGRRLRHEGGGGTGNEDVGDPARGVGSLGNSLGERRHLADAESLPLLCWHSPQGPAALPAPLDISGTTNSLDPR